MRFFCALAVCLLLAQPAQASIRLQDDTGRTLALPRAPQRIVALTPHLTELVFAVGAGGQLVGVDSASDYPAAARNLPRVGDFSRVNIERVLALKPDLVLVWQDGSRAVDIHGLQQRGLPVLQTRATGIQDVARLLRLIGRASGRARVGENAAQQFEAQLAALKSPARARSLGVFYQVWDRPLMTVGGTHWISDALALCGARNVFADLRALSPSVSREAVLRRAPELIVSGSDAPDPRPQWQGFGHVPAVRQGAFVRLDADRLHRPSPRLIEGVAALCQALEPYQR